MSMQLWCLIIDHEQKPVSSCFQVSLPLDACMDELRDEVRKKNPNILRAVDAASLEVWKMTDLRDGEIERIVKDQAIQSIRLCEEEEEDEVALVNDAPVAWSLNPAASLSNGTAPRPDELFFLVQMPAVRGTLRSLY
jgi:hypothetical protein